jgi:hypothetical protein
MSRKTASFSQLINYLNTGRTQNDEYCFKHNIYSNKSYYIVKEFQENYRNLKRRANSNALLHEIISLKHQKNLTIEEQREILKDLAEQYINTRANNNLAYGVIHEQHNQVHCHLMISSNELLNSKNKRLSKNQFREVKAQLEQYAYMKYPKLEQLKQTHKKTKAKTKTIDNEIQLKKRTGKKSDKEIIKEILQAIFSKSKTSQDFLSRLRNEKIQIYQRGKTFGFLDEKTNKKYRLKTLELENDFAEMNNHFMKQENTKNKQSFDNAKSTKHAKFKEQMQEERKATNEKQKTKNNSFTRL